MKTPQKNLADQKTGSKLLGFGLLAGIVLLVLALILTPLGFAEYNYQQKINALKEVVATAEQRVVNPAGGIKSGNQHVKAPHWLDSFCIDTGPCPNVSSAWLLDISKDKEPDLIKSIFSNLGYKSERVDQYETETSGVGSKDGRTMNVTLSPVTSQQPPRVANEGGEWRLLTISVHD